MSSTFGPFLLAAACLALGACASRPLPKYERPLTRTAVQHVRTTAYTHSESNHLRYGARSAAGSILQYGQIHSAAADWSRWPNGTVFRIQETGEVCQVDDYGWALAGTNTIDLYKPDRSDMNAWGVHRVHIEILHWGDPWASYRILQPRKGYAHVRRMLKGITSTYSHRSHGEGPVVAAAEPLPSPPPEPVRARLEVVSAAPAPRASAARAEAPLHPFYP